MINKKKKTKIIEASQAHETDTGSPEVQVSLLSEKIDVLSKHLKKHRKDNHSRRGLLGMVSARRRHLSYLKSKNLKRYQDTLKKVKE